MIYSILDHVSDKLRDLKKDFKMVVTVLQKQMLFSFQDFCKARMTSSSRIFGLLIDNVKTDAFVPLVYFKVILGWHA